MRHLSACLLLVGALAIGLQAQAAPNQRFVLRGPGQVTDGWVSTFAGQSFTEAKLQAHGRAWESYYRGLVRFDLKSLPALRYGRVQRATLRLRAVEAENPKAVPTRVAASDTPWTTAGTFEAPAPGTKWPEQKRYSNPDYAMIADDEASQTITAPGVVELDVTGIVERWLYQGLANNGLLIATGPPVFGKPDAGTWTLAFASSESGAEGPALTVELSGEPPTPATIPARTLRWYPSALLPPVRVPYLFMWYFGEFPRYQGAVVNAAGGPPEITQRGMLPLGWFYGPQNPWWKSEQAFIDAYKSAAQGGALGIMVDEWQPEDPNQEMLKPGNPYGITGSLKGMAEAKKISPGMLIAVAWRGEETIAPVTKQGLPDFLLIEAYTHLNKQFPKEWALDAEMKGLERRIAVARKLGMIEQTVAWLGMILAPEDYHPGERLTPELLDRQLARVRQMAPEMPGVCFYSNGDNALAIAADQLAYKHFVAPAPEVTITAPGFEAAIRTPHVTVRAQATGQDRRRVVRYRWFVDNRLMAESREPTWVWDLRGEHNGPHLVTVHAVDEAWNRAATQVPVTVQLAR